MVKLTRLTVLRAILWTVPTLAQSDSIGRADFVYDTIPVVT